MSTEIISTKDFLAQVKKNILKKNQLKRSQHKVPDQQAPSFNQYDDSEFMNCHSEDLTKQSNQNNSFGGLKHYLNSQKQSMKLVQANSPREHTPLIKSQGLIHNQELPLVDQFFTNQKQQRLIHMAQKYQQQINNTLFKLQQQTKIIQQFDKLDKVQLKIGENNQSKQAKSPKIASSKINNQTPRSASNQRKSNPITPKNKDIKQKKVKEKRLAHQKLLMAMVNYNKKKKKSSNHLEESSLIEKQQIYDKNLEQSGLGSYLQIRSRIGQSLKKRLSRNMKQQEIYKQLLEQMRDIDNGISIRCKDILRDMKYKLENGYIMQEIEINNIIQEIKNDDEYSQHNELIEQYMKRMQQD